MAAFVDSSPFPLHASTSNYQCRHIVTDLRVDAPATSPARYTQKVDTNTIHHTKHMSNIPAPSRRLQTLTALSLILVGAATITNFVYPGTERTMGDIFRLFYIHISTFYGGFFAYLAAALAGLGYLRTHHPKWDHLSIAGVEIGLWLSTITIATGSVWAKRLWGDFWVWDPRLTAVAVMWLTYAAYLFLRAGFEDLDKRRRFAAVYGILAFSSVLFTIAVIRIRTDVMHTPVIGPSLLTGSNDTLLTPRIAQTTLLNVIAYTICAIALMWHRVRLQARREQVAKRKAALLYQLG